MSANDTDTAPVTQNLNVILPSLNSLLTSHSFLSLLVPLVISLFHFSSRQSRRRLIFTLNLAAIFLAFVVGILIDITIHAVLDPLNPMPLAINIAIGFVGVWQSILVDLTLLVRLISVYPPRHIGLKHFFVIAILILLKLARVVNIIIFTVVTPEAASGPDGAVMAGIAFETKPYLKIERATQMIDNTYVSLTFLWRMRSRENKPVSTNSSTLTQRMHTLFYIAATNFVIPTVFSIAQFISVYHGVNEVLLEYDACHFRCCFVTIWANNAVQELEQTLKLNQRRDNITNRSMRTFEFGCARGSHPLPALVSTSSWSSERGEKFNE